MYIYTVLTINLRANKNIANREMTSLIGGVTVNWR